MRRFLVLANPAAGSTDEAHLTAALSTLRARADVRMESCRDAGDLRRVLADRDGRIPVVAGGDGSVHLAIVALRERGELSPDDPLGLVPLGTGNDLARTLRVPLEPQSAARILLAGSPRRLDLLVDELGGVVVNAAHLGIGAEAAEQASAWKARLGKAAYVVGSAAAGTGRVGWSVTVRADERVLHAGEPVLMVAICNGRTIGGGAELAPGAAPDDGWLDVVVATSTGPLARLGFGIAVRDGDHTARDDVLTARARTVTVSGDAFPLNADGELDGPVRSRTWTVLPASWSLLAPPTRRQPHI